MGTFPDAIPDAIIQLLLENLELDAWQVGCAWQAVCVAGETATAVDGTHPTGMHSCFEFCFTEIDLFKYK